MYDVTREKQSKFPRKVIARDRFPEGKRIQYGEYEGTCPPAVGAAGCSNPQYSSLPESIHLR